MKEDKFKEIQKRFDELERELSQPAVIADSQKIKKLNQEYDELRTVIEDTKKIKSIEKSLQETKAIISEENDPELIKIAQEEQYSLTRQKKELEKKIDSYFNPLDPFDKRNIIVEIRAGTGGDEAALFAANLFRMYSRFTEKKSWRTHLISASRTGIGGFKEVVFEISGQEVYSHLKYESGVHRVQRIPETEKSGRVHTSTASVAVLPEAEEIDIEIKPEDLKIDTFASSGHGGQSVNTTASAVRITHLPTNLVVSCQDERSQKQNKEKALQVLRARLLAQKKEREKKNEDETRKKQIGSAYRAEKIRTYNFPQERITDHRIKKSWHNIHEILDGQLESIISELKKVEENQDEN